MLTRRARARAAMLGLAFILPEGPQQTSVALRVTWVSCAERPSGFLVSRPPFPMLLFVDVGQ